MAGAGAQARVHADICRWGLGVKYPARISATGGHYMFDDDQETPNTMVVNYEFNENGKKQLMVFETRHWISNHEAGIGAGKSEFAGGNTVGNTFFGSKGYLAIDGYTHYKTFMGKNQEPGPTRTQGVSHFGNFFGAVRSRKREELNAEIEEGAISCVLMHLGNIAYRLGRTLTFDSKTMSCVGDAEANKMFTRAYRAPFVVPAKV